MANKTLEMAIAIKGQLDGSLGSAMTRAVAQTEQMKNAIKAMNREMASLQKAADKQQKRKGYVEYDTDLAMLALQAQLSDEMQKQDALQGKINRKKEAAVQFDRATGQLKTAAVSAAVLAAPLVMATNAAIHFETAMSDVRKTVDFDTPQQFKEMNQDILTLSQNLPMSAEGIAKIVAAGGQAGIAREDLMGFAQDAVKMGIAFDISADQAGDMMAKWRTAFGMSQEQVVQLADQVNYLSNVTAAGSDDISDIVTRVGPLGEVAGVNAAQIAAMGASMSSVGVQSEIAATGIKNMLLGLSSGAGATKTQAEAFMQLGTTAEEVAARMQTDAQGTIIDILSRIKEVPKEMQAAVLSDMFGTESIGAIAPLLTQLDNLKTNFQRVGDASQYAGSMEAEYEARAGTTSNQIQMTKNNITALAINIGSVLLPSINSALQTAAAMAGTLAAWAGENQGVVETILAIVGAIAGLTMAALTIRAAASWFSLMKASIDLVAAATNRAMIAQRANAVASRASAIATTVWSGVTRAAAVAQAALNAVLMLNPYVLIAVAIIALVGYIIYLWNTNEAFREAVIADWETIKTTVINAVTAVSNFLLQLPDYCQEAGSAFVSAAGAWASNAYNAVMDWIGKIPGAISDAISGAWEGIKATFSSGVNVGVNVAHNASGGIYERGAFLTTFAERSAEAAIPLDGSARAISLWQQAGRRLGVIPQQQSPGVIPRLSAGGSGTTHISFAPEVKIYGGGQDVAAQVSAVLDQKMRDFEQMMNRLEERKRRLSYG